MLAWNHGLTTAAKRRTAAVTDQSHWAPDDVVAHVLLGPGTDTTTRCWHSTKATTTLCCWAFHHYWTSGLCCKTFVRESPWLGPSVECSPCLDIEALFHSMDHLSPRSRRML